jgi:cell division protein ZapA (FtsZ GTPase activity inhibitor)
MDELSIKVSIANRVYPLKIRRNDEERVRKAAKMVNDRIKEFETQFAGNDKFDFVAMCALQFANELVELQDNTARDNQEVHSEVGEIDNRLNEYFSRYSVH